MSMGAFRAQLMRSVNLLDDLGLLMWHRLDGRGDVPVASLRSRSYIEQWRTLYNASAYDILLKDLSLFQFTLESDGSARYAYLEGPIQVQSYEEFAWNLYGAMPTGDSYPYWDEYEEEVATAPAKLHVCPVRYDYSEAQYSECEHPAAHLHVGAANDIRLACRRRWEPLTFVLFVVRQLYVAYWRKFLAHAEAEQLSRLVRESIDKVEVEYWRPRDLWQVYLR
jgi:hypothetical protein